MTRSEGGQKSGQGTDCVEACMPVKGMMISSWSIGIGSQ